MIDIYYLYRFAGAAHACEHHLLVRARRPSFSNAIEREVEDAQDAAERERDRLCADYARRLLPARCGAAHSQALIGEMQVFPVGDGLFVDGAREALEVWVAQSEYGPPWVALGTAASEEDFWREAEEDDADDAVSTLKPIPPARRLTVFFYPSGASGDTAVAPSGEG